MILGNYYRSPNAKRINGTETADPWDLNKIMKEIKEEYKNLNIFWMLTMDGNCKNEYMGCEDRKTENDRKYQIGERLVKLAKEFDLKCIGKGIKTHYKHIKKKIIKKMKDKYDDDMKMEDEEKQIILEEQEGQIKYKNITKRSCIDFTFVSSELEEKGSFKYKDEEENEAISDHYLIINHIKFGKVNVEMKLYEEWNYNKMNDEKWEDLVEESKKIRNKINEKIKIYENNKLNWNEKKDKGRN